MTEKICEIFFFTAVKILHELSSDFSDKRRTQAIILKCFAVAKYKLIVCKDSDCNCQQTLLVKNYNKK